jgi:IS30 family transposase
MTVVNVLNDDSYFIRHYTSQDKEIVENRIGKIRRFLRKKTDLSMVNSDQVKRVERLLKNRPVRKFIYKSLTKCYLKKLHLLL